MGSIIKMYGATTGGAENAIAQVDIPMGGDLLGVQWSVSGNPNADTEDAWVQLSFRSAGSFTTNDDRGIISEARAKLSFTTSGSSLMNINFYVALPDIPIGAGERLYLHSSNSAGVVLAVACLLHFGFDIDKVSSRRR